MCLGFYRLVFALINLQLERPEKREKALELTVALDFSFSGCSLQLPTDLAHSSAESHAYVSASAQHLTVPWLLQVRASCVVQERDWLPQNFLSQKAVEILSCHEGIISRFIRDFNYKETNLCEVVYNCVSIEKVDGHGLPCLLSHCVTGVCLNRLLPWCMLEGASLCFSGSRLFLVSQNV